ncbi:MAG: VOC family protein [Actinomycetota bacterium]|nr:VOC family protein [Actinomycetota bacterium]
MQIAFDAADPVALSQFWAEALHYRLEDPPAGFDSWPAFLSARGVPESQWNSASALVDPHGTGPRIFFQRVPEPKTAKNRVHIDLQSGGGARVELGEQKVRVETEIERLVGLGAVHFETREELGVVWAVLRDPEGNEFCA